MTLDTYFEANKANWDGRVPIHVTSKSYDVPGFLAGKLSLLEEDIAAVGDVAGKSLVHLQCHFGMDTLSWARLGAKVTGLDFSPAAVEQARELATKVGINADFVEANVYDAVEALGGRQFDVVFTGVGALCWLPDVRGWAKVVGASLAPGGTFYIREGHPVLWSLFGESGELRIHYPYFEVAEPMTWDEDVTYTDNPLDLRIPATRMYEWNHGLGEVVTALIEAGLVIEFVHEFRHCYWQALPSMVKVDDERWMLPEHERDLVPVMYSIRAHKPG